MMMITLLQTCALLLSVALEVVVVGAKTPNKADMVRPGCMYTCGGVSIPFPFGIGPNCFFDEWFEIECRTNHSAAGSISSKPFLSKFGAEVMEITLRSEITLSSQELLVRMPPPPGPKPNEQSGATERRMSPIDLRGSPYQFSLGNNVFGMKGCPGSAVLVDQRNAAGIAGCATVCNSSVTLSNHSCYGLHCCQAPLPWNNGFPLQFYQIELSGEDVNTSLAATILFRESVTQFAGSLSASAFPVALGWGVPSNRLPRPSHHVYCIPQGIYHPFCYCDINYEGNPYLPNGCKAPDGCDNCRGDCIQAPDYTHSNPTYKCAKSPPLNLGDIIGISSSFGVLLLAASIYGLYLLIKWRRDIKRRNRFYKRNGGLLLQQQLSSNKGVVERTKIFSVRELDKATDHFHDNRILGQGGQGTVYKGMLTDGSIVAVKKSKLLDESQLEQFINEVVILSRVSHRNVVKLFGCCLETEVPLLVYEFVPNGTLFQHIHDPDEDFSITWAMRLKIAADSAGAIAYLHSSSSIPVYHRDVKSLNILLDEKHRAKVSDFGSSKTIAIDQTHMTTLVQGTMGYLDPEYFQTYQFNGKSDVYSFGVVILELLTSKKPIYRDASSMEQKNLVTEFLFHAQNSRLSDILDPKVVTEAKEDELISTVELAKRCICWSGKLRPTMKEVAMTLDMIMKSPAEVSAWYQQQEAFPIQYAAYDEFDMSDISGAEFMSNTLPASCSSPPYTDEISLLSDAI